jgi:hypothetical protein
MHIRLFLAMTFATHFIHLLVIKHRIISGMNLMAGDASNTFKVVDTAVPFLGFSLLVTSETNTVLAGGRQLTVWAKINHRLFATTVVVAKRAMTGLTLQASHRRLAVVE